MSPPSYRWTCQNCQQHNAAGTESCAACDFPACATGHEVAAFKKGIVPERPVKTRPPRSDPPKNPLLPLAKLFWWAGGLFAPFSIFLAAHFGTPGHGGPGGWGSGFFILLTGIMFISPSLVVSGVLALLAGDHLKKERYWLGGLFGLLLGGCMLLLCGEIYLLLLFL